MLYAIIATDQADSLAKHMAARPAHLARLEHLHAEQRLVLAGPHPATEQADGFTGNLIVAEFESLTVAKEWAAQNPYLHAGVFAHVSVKPFRQVLP